MDPMDQINERLDDHEDRLKSLETTRADTLKALAELDGKHEQRLREVRQGLEKQIERMERDARERDKVNADSLQRIERKQDKMVELFAKAIKKTPPWVGPLLGLLVAAAGWAVDIALHYHG